MDRVDAVFLSVQPHAAAGGVDAVRPDRGRPSGRPADCRPALRRLRGCCARRARSNRCSRSRCRTSRRWRETRGDRAGRRDPPPVGESRWQFPPPSRWPDGDVIAAGGDLEPATLIAAYRAGPLPDGRRRARAGARLVVAGSARHRAARRPARHPVDAAEREALRGSHRHLLRRRHPRAAAIRRARAAGSPRTSSRPTRRCTSSDGRTASRSSIARAARRRPVRRAHQRAVRGRVDVPPCSATRRRWR